MLQIMTYDTPYIKKALQKYIDTIVSLYVLSEVFVEGIYYNYTTSNLGFCYCSRNDTKVHIA